MGQTLQQRMRRYKTYMGVEEQGVIAPGERLAPPVHVVVDRGLGKHTAVLVLDVLDVCGVFSLGIVDPGSADSNYEFESDLANTREVIGRRTGRESDVVADRYS